MSANPVVEQTPVKTTSSNRNKIDVRLQAVTYLAEDICSFEFVDPDGNSLPAFTAGAHIDVHLPDGLIRQYSLYNSPAETHRYAVAVLRDVNGRGGSMAMHDRLRVGDRVTLSLPRNQFALSEQATRHILLAGGIGITPLMAMIEALQADGKDFHLYYCTRSPQRTAFLANLQPLIERGQVTIHHDQGKPENALDLNRILADCPPDTHLYYCGPGGFLDAVERAAAAWPAKHLHCERFSAPAADPEAAPAAPETPFEVRLALSDLQFTVPPGRSVVDVLADNGIEVDVSCKEGYCGTCMTRYLDGQPEHRDTVLDDEDRQEFVMICCCRARTDCLVLDL